MLCEFQVACVAFVCGFRYKLTYHIRVMYLSSMRMKVCSQITDNINNQVSRYAVYSKNWARISNGLHKKETGELLDDLKARVIDLAQMNGASSWLSTIPLSSENYVFNKQEFNSALCIRYGWSLKQRLQTKYLCGKMHYVHHVMISLKGGFIIQSHRMMV